MTFREFFRRATGHPPHPYQRRFAEATELPHLIRAPTGAGKTATAVVGWLWRRSSQEGTPRRLVYCLPMRVLVEQSANEACNWIELLFEAGLLGDVKPKVHILMGGVDTEKWFLDPEAPAVLIGTQDMLLSRALNRGYAASRFHWPIDFGLLNNDCLWVFDEPQLMGSGVSTSAQMAGLRQTIGTIQPCPSIWMSATLEPGWLETVDFRGKFGTDAIRLGEDKFGNDYTAKSALLKRMTAAKTLAPLGASSTKDMKDVAQRILGKGGDPLHQPGTQTLVIVNTVERAKALCDQLKKGFKEKETPELFLIHSRFRQKDRAERNAKLQDKVAKDRIIVATQVVEAGVDISSRTLITEVAPWASVVQRIGRCNRAGDDGTTNDPARVFWIDFDEKLGAPYEGKDLAFSRACLEKLDGQDVSPRSLDEFKEKEEIFLPFEHRHVLRRRDLLDLFDTAPDLSGNDIDVARFVRGDDPDRDVQVFWRRWETKKPPADEAAPRREELCMVPVYGPSGLKEFLKKSKHKGYVWDHLDDEWRPVRDAERELHPGMVVLLPSVAGGYSDLGWDPGSTTPVEPLTAAGGPPQATASDPLSALSLPKALTIAEHTENVCRELKVLLKALGDAVVHSKDLTTAARWHDVGKAHEAFQAGVRALNPDLVAGSHWAKSGKKGRLRYTRRYFRHELASALAALQQEVPFFAAYLVASHHGRVRLSIRSLPDEFPLPEDGVLFALGVHGGDQLPKDHDEIDLGGGVRCPQLSITLQPMQLGGDESWTARSLKLLAELGPFRLAYLESLLRAADVRASEKESKNG